jgi:hypothetical protein
MLLLILVFNRSTISGTFNAGNMQDPPVLSIRIGPEGMPKRHSPVLPPLRTLPGGRCRSRRYPWSCGEAVDQAEPLPRVRKRPTLYLFYHAARRRFADNLVEDDWNGHQRPDQRSSPSCWWEWNKADEAGGYVS